MERLAGKKILITGGAGFIGGHLVELLLREKSEITVIDIQKPGRTYFFLNRLHANVDYRILDITKKNQLTHAFASMHPSYVVHLAAFPIVAQAYENPYETFKTNVMGTVNILEECRHRKEIIGIIVASSDKAYGKTAKPYTENAPLKGDHPYDVSKSCEDLIAQTYFKTYNLPIVITRFGNVYGEGDMHLDRIVPGICKSLALDTPLQIRSDGTYIRDYIYVKDVALAYTFLLKRIQSIAGEAYNISSETTCTVLEMKKYSEKIFKKNLSYTILNNAVNEIRYQHLNNNKISKLGWKPVFTFEKAIRRTYRWYKKNITKK